MPDDKNDSMARMMFNIVRLSELLNVPIEDAATIYIKTQAALEKAMADHARRN